MATVATPLLEPNVEAVTRHLATLFAPCASDYAEGLVEIAYGVDKPDSAALFPINKVSMAEAVAFAVEQNRRGQNVYVGVNPRKPGTNDNRRASDRDVEISFWQFADLDDAQVVALARERMPIQPSMIVLTGRTPSNRPHFYWQLEEPVTNLQAWADRQKGIADTLQGDRVINPSRIMRLAGTINYPSLDKAAKRGYAVELTSVKTDFADERPPVTPEQIAQAFPQAAPVAAASGLPTVSVQEGQTTLSAMARSKSADLISACQSGNQWHNNMIALVAHLAAIGTPWSVILGLAPAITLPGFTVAQTVDDMQKALHGAAIKWGIAPPDEQEAEARATEQREGVFTVLDMDELEALPPPVYIVDDLLTETGLAVLYGDPGSGKSFVALDIALRLAFGMDWHGKATKQTGVLYIAGEGHAGLGKRVKGWRREHGLEGADAPFLLLPEAVQMLEDGEVGKLLRTIDAAVERAAFPIGVVVLDTVSRSLTGADENSQDAMSKFVHSCSIVQRHINGAALGVHHTGKDVSKGMRGSTVLIGACDTSIKCEGDLELSKTVTLTVEKQKDGEQIPPVTLSMKVVEWAAGLAKPVTTLVPLVGTAEAVPAAAKSLTREQRVAVFEEIAKRWRAGDPFSNVANTGRHGRYLPRWISNNFETAFADACDLVQAWIDRGLIVSEIYNKRNSTRGLSVVEIPQDWIQ